MTGRLFLVDDDPDDVMIFCEALSEIDSSIACDFEQDPRKAVTKIIERAIKPDIIFLDLNMPVFDGWQVLEAIKANAASRAIPVVIYSTLPLDRDIRRAKKLGASCYFSKPLDFIELRTNLRVVITAFNNGELNQVSSHFQY